MRNLLLKADTVRRLGLLNVGRVIAYRALLKAGAHPVQRVRRKIGGQIFFRTPEAGMVDAGSRDRFIPPSHWQQDALYFGWHRTPLNENPPDWFENPFTGARVAHPDRPWWELSDFESGVGDIKTVWEASRFDWVLADAQRAACGQAACLARLNKWLSDWCVRNHCYRGPNWKCGQEASIRVMHLLLAARFLGQLDKPEPALVTLVEAHLARIYPTLAYAMAQDNNHGTSEAAALFMGGKWLVQHDVDAGSKWARSGRRWLENRAARLIEPDGGFSQHSVNYHRLMLDTLCLTELWRRWYDLPAFSKRFYERARAATDWLHAMVDPVSGDAPNLGANDGANLLPLTDADYRDYRPTVQLASLVFEKVLAYPHPGPHQAHLRWMGLETPNSADKPELDSVFHARGYIVLRHGPWKAVLRYPYYRFRPSHCDALHLDLWLGSNNLLRDAGSYSYNTEPELVNDFTGPAGHNSIQLDDRDPMPKISRFLRGAWLKAEQVSAPKNGDGMQTATASYRDWLGAHHLRKIALSEDGLRVIDQVAGFRERAVLRWRLAPGQWQLDGQRGICRVQDECEGAGDREHVIEITSNVHVRRLEIVSGWESRYYLHKETGSILEAEICEPGQLITEYRVLP